MAYIQGEHYLRCPVCTQKFHQSKMRRDYRGYLACREHVEPLPPAQLMPLPKLRQSLNLPAGQLSLPSLLVQSYPDTWDSIEDFWNLITVTWNAL